MKAWRRSGDWANLILGAYLFFVPFFAVANAASAWNAYVVGALIFCVALYALAQPESKGVEWINVVLGAWLIVAGWAARGLRPTTASASVGSHARGPCYRRRTGGRTQDRPPS